ncbi:MAG TPA: HAMP domain-containing sensor histidine kinase [Elusimicrobiales bacterium]|nr:HAMP domain-containing sensor histidine kinase [Elusimicrobiales bacterium]
MANVLSAIKKSYASKTVPKYGFVTQIYQPIFILFLMLLVFLAKDSPQLVFPQLFYLLGGFLLCNALTNYSLSKFKVSYWLVDLMAVFNCLVVTGIMYYSGGGGSYLWVLYLFPIFSALVLLDYRQMMGVIFLIFLSWSFVYGNPYNWGSEIFLDFGGKALLIIIGTVLISRFVGEKKKIESKMQLQRDRLNAMQTEMVEATFQPLKHSGIMEVGQKASKIIHDLGTPVTIILGSSRMLLETEIPLKQDIQRIIDASLLCKSIISNALDTAGDKNIKLEKLDIVDTLDSALSITEPLFVLKGISVKKTYANKKVFVKGNSIILERLFINVITNAKKVMSDGDKLTVRLKIKDDSVNILFEDSGPGFPSELLESGPEMFKTARHEGHGTGLGLIVSKEMAKKHGGDLYFANRPSKGAVVTVSIPTLKPS